MAHYFKAARAGGVPPEKERAQGSGGVGVSLISVGKYLKGGCEEGTARLFPVAGPEVMVKNM